MTDTMTKIAAGLERAFAERGFAEPSVEDLRDVRVVHQRERLPLGVEPRQHLA